ncbi:histone H1-delta-like [Liolophura sinensis]|uniref:histone H1-delta-like n=1 Tax=Liolophura sinensis TaxID=3198878 RepID=UPI0031594023
MSDAPVAVDAPAEAVAPSKPAKAAKSPAKKKVSKPKKPANHPKYSEMIRDAIVSLKERGGASRQKILKYIMANYNVGKDEKIVNSHLKMSLKAGVKNLTLKQAKGTGASGSFRLGQQKSEKPKKLKKPTGIKPKTKKVVKKVKKSPAKKAKKEGEKKVKKTKKVSAKPKVEKKVAKPKPKKAKSPAKKAAKAKPKKTKAAPKKK